MKVNAEKDFIIDLFNGRGEARVKCIILYLRFLMTHPHLNMLFEKRKFR